MHECVYSFFFFLPSQAAKLHLAHRPSFADYWSSIRKTDSLYIFCWCLSTYRDWLECCKWILRLQQESTAESISYAFIYAFIELLLYVHCSNRKTLHFLFFKHSHNNKGKGVKNQNELWLKISQPRVSLKCFNSTPRKYIYKGPSLYPLGVQRPKSFSMLADVLAFTGEVLPWAIKWRPRKVFRLRHLLY